LKFLLERSKIWDKGDYLRTLVIFMNLISDGVKARNAICGLEFRNARTLGWTFLLSTITAFMPVFRVVFIQLPKEDGLVGPPHFRGSIVLKNTRPDP
jgi:hypothetical protein